MEWGPPYHDTRDGDDRRFLRLLARVTQAADASVHHLVVIRVDNWFDHKWLRFSGIGRVPYQWITVNHPGVALDPFSQEHLTFPPFSPRRILGEDVWTRDGDEPLKHRVHRRRRTHSSWNLQRRVADFSNSIVATWFSSRTEDNGQGSIMQYASHAGRLEAWYASLRRGGSSWRLHHVKGAERARIENIVHPDDAPPSGERTTKPNDEPSPSGNRMS
jgi:hypothetical protein